MIMPPILISPNAQMKEKFTCHGNHMILFLAERRQRHGYSTEGHAGIGHAGRHHYH